MTNIKAKRQSRSKPTRPHDETRAAWQPPTVQRVGTIAELVQQTKVSGNQDAGGSKRHL